MKRIPTKQSYSALLIICAIAGVALAGLAWSVVEMFESLKQFL